MKIIGNRILVSKLEEVKKEGFETVEVQDSFVCKGKVEQIDSLATPVFPCVIGDTVIFAKYSPDTHEVEHEGKKYKIINVSDILAIL